MQPTGSRGFVDVLGVMASGSKWRTNASAAGSIETMKGGTMKRASKTKAQAVDPGAMPADREIEMTFFRANRDLFDLLSDRLGRCAIDGDMESMARYVSYIEQILGVAIRLSRKVLGEGANA